MKVLILLLAVGAWAIPNPKLVASVDRAPQCTVSDWGTWVKTQVVRGAQHFSFPAKVSREWDAGRDRMVETMARKEFQFSRPLAKTAADYDFQGEHSCTGGWAGDIECWNVDKLSFLDHDQMGYDRLRKLDLNPRGNDIWGWTDPITGDEYAIVGLSGATAFVRITDPKNPVSIAMLYSHTAKSTWRDMKIIGNWAYIGSEAADHGMQVFDLTRLRGVNSFLGEVDADRHYAGVGNSHNIVANEDTNFIYIVGATKGNYAHCSGGLHAVDVSNPRNPRFAGCFDEDGYTHDAQCVVYRGPDARYFDHEVCFAFNEDSLTIVDVTDKNNMHAISKVTYDGVEYSHQGWATEDHALLLLDDELDEMYGPEENTKTLIWNIQNLENPVLVNTHYHPHTCIDHNQYIRGAFTYQANYESGLRIMYINRQDNTLREVGYFDIYPDGTTANFGGSWSIFPYFRSGTVVINSIEYGLFVVRPNYFELEMEVMTPTAQSVETRSRSVVSKDEGALCPSLIENKVKIAN